MAVSTATGLEMKTYGDQILVSMALLREPDEEKIDPVIWVKEGNRGGLDYISLKDQIEKGR